jgi:hypothetical protein
MSDMFKITKEDVMSRQSALSTILGQMNVPDRAMDTSILRNLLWINRNLAIQNRDHPLFQTANELTAWLLKHRRLNFN